MEIEGLSRSAEKSFRFFIAAHPGDPVSLNRDGLRRGLLLIHGYNMGIQDEQVRAGRWRAERASQRKQGNEEQTENPCQHASFCRLTFHGNTPPIKTGNGDPGVRPIVEVAVLAFNPELETARTKK